MKIIFVLFSLILFVLTASYSMAIEICGKYMAE